MVVQILQKCYGGFALDVSIKPSTGVPNTVFSKEWLLIFVPFIVTVARVNLSLLVVLFL